MTGESGWMSIPVSEFEMLHRRATELQVQADNRAQQVEVRNEAIKRANAEIERLEGLNLIQHRRIDSDHADYERMAEQLRLTVEALGKLTSGTAPWLAALKHIRDHEGRVCETFEVCTHRSCASSYAAWAYVDAALRGMTPEQADKATVSASDSAEALEH